MPKGYGRALDQEAWQEPLQLQEPYQYRQKDKLILRYKVTDAAVDDSQVFDDVLGEENSGRSVWADSAYRSKEREKRLEEAGYNSRIRHKGTRVKKPYTQQ